MLVGAVALAVALFASGCVVASPTGERYACWSTLERVARYRTDRSVTPPKRVWRTVLERRWQCVPVPTTSTTSTTTTTTSTTTTTTSTTTTTTTTTTVPPAAVRHVALSVCASAGAFDDLSITHADGSITDDFDRAAGSLVGTNSPAWVAASDVGLPSETTATMGALHTNGSAATVPGDFTGCVGSNQAFAAVPIADSGTVDIDVTLSSIPAGGYMAVTLVDGSAPHTSLVITADGGGQLFHTVAAPGGGSESQPFHVFDAATFDTGDRVSLTVDGDSRAVRMDFTTLYDGDGDGLVALMGICDTPGGAGGALLDDFVSESPYGTLASDDFSAAAGTVVGGAGRWVGPLPVATTVQPVFYDGSGRAELPASSGVSCDETTGEGVANAATSTVSGRSSTGFTLARMPAVGALTLMLGEADPLAVLAQLVVFADGGAYYTSPSEAGSFAAGTFTVGDVVRVESSAAGFTLTLDGTTIHPV